MDLFEPLLFGAFLGKPGWMWLAFIGIVITLLVLDLGVLHRDDREIKVRESLLLSVGYIGLGLLFGVFEYRDRGILDNTHLRFYTMRTIRKELENAGFRVLAVRGSSVPVRLIIGKWTPEPILRLGERVLTIVTRVWKSLFAYQIILVAARK